MRDNAIDIDALLAAPDDPHFIKGVFNYCDRRCERCPFTSRCRLYADEEHDRLTQTSNDWQERVHRSFQRTFELLKGW